jgi:hypothetical protein
MTIAPMNYLAHRHTPSSRYELAPPACLWARSRAVSGNIAAAALATTTLAGKGQRITARPGCLAAIAIIHATNIGPSTHKGSSWQSTSSSQSKSLFLSLRKVEWYFAPVIVFLHKKLRSYFHTRFYPQSRNRFLYYLVYGAVSISDYIAPNGTMTGERQT